MIVTNTQGMLRLWGMGTALMGWLGIWNVAIAEPMLYPKLWVTLQRVTQHTCPTDVETLVALLIRDLPSYANRQTRSSVPLRSALNPASHMIVAGRPEFEPLPLKPGESPPSRDADPTQVFISTLERQYAGDRAFDLQQYHWLFLTRSAGGWRLVFMFTRTASPTPNTPPTPPRDSSDGAIARAIRTWLRDCRAGVIRG
ncbi:MAG: hypothetical protein NZ772_06640 [Cyanobacteria bacterium]|nr:hypothetical protein [Cyanobacteriota bacterium]MDW8200967.1 hypothetical protein [Cyanobacteriota bacterium SKYGB_h_bin112]